MAGIVKTWAYWIAYSVASVLVSAVGFVVVAPLAALRLTELRRSYLPAYEGRLVLAWRGGRLTALWGNDEDGVYGPEWFRMRYPGRPRWAAYVWCALRNSANGMRLLPGAMLPLPADAVTTRLGPIQVCTSGPYQCVYLWRLRFGWGIQPGAKAGWLTWPVLQSVQPN
jgi:hypothetical protein